MVPVATPEVAGVVVQRHTLDLEARRLSTLASRLGRRLKRTLVALPPEIVPNEDWRKSFELYERTVINMLREQRERAKLAAKGGGPPLGDAEFEAELAALAKETLEGMPEREFRALCAARLAQIDAESIEREPV